MMRYILLYGIFCIFLNNLAAEKKVRSSIKEIFSERGIQAIKNEPLFERMPCVNSWIDDRVIERNWNYPCAVVDFIASFITEDEINATDENNATPLVYCLRDSKALNFGLFGLGASLKSYNDTDFSLFGEYSLIFSETILCVEKEFRDMADDVLGGVHGFRIGGKNCVFKSQHPLPNCTILAPEEKVRFWKEALWPSIWCGAFQSHSVHDNETWSIGDLKKRAKLFLLVCKRLQKQKGIKLPKLMVLNCIVPHIFAQPLKAIEDRWNKVYEEMLPQIKLLYTEVDERSPSESCFSGKPYIEAMSPEQRGFFENFKTWYLEAVKKRLDGPFALVEILIDQHNNPIN